MADKPTQITIEGRGTVFSLDELRVVLSDSIRDLRVSEASAANVNAISNATGKILSSVKLQMEYYRLIGRTPDIPILLSKTDQEAVA
jgi:hypothetical protein